MGRKFKIISAVALSLVGASLLYAFLLLVFKVYSGSIKSLDNSSGTMGEAIGHGCSVVVHVVAICFTLIVKAVGLLVGFTSCFAKKRKASIITASVFTCVIALLSAFCGIVVFVWYFPLAGTNINAVLTWIALILMPITDLLWTAVAIYRAVVLSKQAKQVKKEDEGSKSEENIILNGEVE